MKKELTATTPAQTDNREYLCKCVNCGAILFDENPQTDAVKQPVTGNEQHMIQKEDDGGIHWACPNCETDAHLIDISDKKTDNRELFTGLVKALEESTRLIAAYYPDEETSTPKERKEFQKVLDTNQSILKRINK